LMCRSSGAAPKPKSLEATKEAVIVRHWSIGWRGCGYTSKYKSGVERGIERCFAEGVWAFRDSRSQRCGGLAGAVN
jgi:hypothetical protein